MAIQEQRPIDSAARMRGACLVEYALLAALISVSIAGIVQCFMEDTSTGFAKTGCVLNGPPEKTAPAWGNTKKVDCYKLLNGGAPPPF